jgi:hypothetical protein
LGRLRPRRALPLHERAAAQLDARLLREATLGRVSASVQLHPCSPPAAVTAWSGAVRPIGGRSRSAGWQTPATAAALCGPDDHGLGPTTIERCCRVSPGRIRAGAAWRRQRVLA